MNLTSVANLLESRTFRNSSSTSPSRTVNLLYCGCLKGINSGDFLMYLGPATMSIGGLSSLFNLNPLKGPESLASVFFAEKSLQMLEDWPNP